MNELLTALQAAGIDLSWLPLGPAAPALGVIVPLLVAGLGRGFRQAGGLPYRVWVRFGTWTSPPLVAGALTALVPAFAREGLVGWQRFLVGLFAGALIGWGFKAVKQVRGKDARLGPPPPKEQSVERLGDRRYDPE